MIPLFLFCFILSLEYLVFLQIIWSFQSHLIVRTLEAFIGKVDGIYQCSLGITLIIFTYFPLLFTPFLLIFTLVTWSIESWLNQSLISFLTLILYVNVTNSRFPNSFPLIYHAILTQFTYSRNLSMKFPSQALWFDDLSAEQTLRE